MMSSHAEVLKVCRSGVHNSILHLSSVQTSTDDPARPHLEISEFKCTRYFDWSIECIRQTKLPINSHQLHVEEDDDFDSVISQHTNGVPGGVFLLHVTGTVVDRIVVGPKDVPGVFQYEVKGLHRPYTLTATNIRTDGNVCITLYGDGMKLSPLLPGGRYSLADVEVTACSPHVAWIGNLTKSVAVDLSSCSIGITGSVSCKKHLMWNVLSTCQDGSCFVIDARLVKLIKLELFIDEHADGGENRPINAKLVMSMDDSSCGFLGVCFGAVVAYALGIGQQAWQEISDYVRRKGRVYLGMVADDMEGPLEVLLRRCFKRLSLRNNREMLVTLLANSHKRANDSKERMVPFRSCIDRERNQWATFKTHVHPSSTVKILDVRVNMAGANLRSQFITFCNFGVGGTGNKTTLTDKNLTKMFKDCKLYGKSLTSTDTDIAFSKVKEKGKKEIVYDEFQALLRQVAPKYAKDHKVSPDEGYAAICDAVAHGGPSLSGTTGVSKTGAVDRMTDHTQYTGSHKERFDETGRGKGAEGRANVDQNSGYVGNYKLSGAYDKLHK